MGKKRVVLYFGSSDKRNIQAHQCLEQLSGVRVKTDTSLARARGLARPLPWAKFEDGGHLLCGITAIRAYVRTHRPKRRHFSFQAATA